MKKTITLLSIMFCMNISAQIINTIAGTTSGYSGDGGPASIAKLNYASGIASDASGNLYIADAGNNRIRKVDVSTNIITTICGNGTNGFSGDGGLATAAELNDPIKLTLDQSGNIYIADAGNYRIRKIDASTNIITTVAGNGTNGFTGDGGLATSAALSANYIKVDASGNLYIAGGPTIRKVNISTGIINTIAGNGTSGFSGDGGLATAAELDAISGIAFDVAGNLFVSTYNRVRKIDASTNIITTIAGNGTGGYTMDGIAATSSELNQPDGIAIDSYGNVYVADNNNNRVRKITASSGIISTIAGVGTLGYSGDGGVPTNALINGPGDIMFDTKGNFYMTCVTRIRYFCNSGINISVNSPSICIGTTATLTASNASTYNWNTGASGATIVVSPTTTMTYTVSGTTSNFCVNPVHSTVTVNSLPPVIVNPSSYSICIGSTAYMQANGADTYIWNGGAVGDTYPVSPTVTTNYTVTGTNALTNCKNTATSVVIVNPKPNVIVVSNKTNLCLDSSAILSASGATTYTWNTSANTSTIAISPTVTTTYSLVGGDSNGCKDTVTITQVVVDCSLTNINKYESNYEVNIYPNPSNGNFIIETYSTEKQTLKIFDATGKLVLNQSIDDKANIDASHLNAGVYNLTIINSKGISNKRLVIIR